MRVTLLVASMLLLGGCRTSAAPREQEAPAASSAVSAVPSASAPESASPASAPNPAALPTIPPPDSSVYGWLKDESRPFPPPAGSLLERFPAPAGYARVPVKPGSFGHWLRYLPVAAPSTPVVSHEGETVLPGDDEYVAAVLAMDVGKKNLQHGADVALRLHAEWLWGTTDRAALSYRANAKLDMPFEKYLRGERVSASGGTPRWEPLGKPAEASSHEAFRDYLDSVFNWVNTLSIMSQSSAPDVSSLRPGDFLVHDGSPAQAVVVLDIARDAARGRTLVLLGRALSPAQSIHVVSIGAKIAWFEISPPTPLLTPRTKEFEWSGLRRFEAEDPAAGAH